MPENGIRLPWQPRRAPSWKGYGSRSWTAGTLIERLEPLRLARGGRSRAHSLTMRTLALGLTFRPANTRSH